MENEKKMDVIVCERCKRLFKYVSGPSLCFDCNKMVEEKFRDVKHYIDEHEHVTMSRVADEMNVSVEQIKRWIKEEKLSVEDVADFSLTCKHCGEKISQGRYCSNCKKSVAWEIGEMYRQESPGFRSYKDSNNRIYFQIR